jgi:glutamine amidotransferase
MKDLVIVDYGMANLRSVQKAFSRLGVDATITADPNRVSQSSHLVLPGVGAFADAIAALRSTGLDQPILEHLRADRPFLGICLGLQMLFERGLEDGEHRGLGWFAGDVVRFPDRPGLIVPHMGWNTVEHGPAAGEFLGGTPPGTHFYFVHSYHARPTEPIAALTCDYGDGCVAAVSRGRCHAVQFHPEKSQAAGLDLLGRFAALKV